MIYKDKIPIVGQIRVERHVICSKFNKLAKDLIDGLDNSNHHPYVDRKAIGGKYADILADFRSRAPVAKFFRSRLYRL